MSKYHFTLVFSMLILLGLSMLAQAAQNNVVGHWTFERGEELKDLTGNFADITLKGAEIKDGQLDVGAGKWAVASGYSGPEIGEKTMVSWASLDDLDVQAGSILTIDRISVDEFDAMVFGERQPHRWMAGSSFFRRTQDPKPGFEETKTGELVQMAYTYEDDGGNAHIKLYRNGELFGDYTQGALATWEKDDAEVFFGIRHGNVGGGPGNLDAHIEEARIYGEVLSQAEIKKLRVGGESVNLCSKIATLWAAVKTK